jgi:hypothetical protein
MTKKRHFLGPFFHQKNRHVTKSRNPQMFPGNAQKRPKTGQKQGQKLTKNVKKRSFFSCFFRVFRIFSLFSRFSKSPWFLGSKPSKKPQKHLKNDQKTTKK